LSPAILNHPTATTITRQDFVSFLTASRSAPATRRCASADEARQRVEYEVAAFGVPVAVPAPSGAQRAVLHRRYRGLVVGLFGSVLPKSLAPSPLAVAFLVGYAVEAFFSRLDGLIARFKSADQVKRASAQEGSGD
jgi:hypothetical protein